VFKELAACAGAEVFAAELFFELFAAVDDAQPGFNALFGGIAASAFAHRFEKSGRLRERGTWDTSLEKELVKWRQGKWWTGSHAVAWRSICVAPAGL
jgi:hypothetical protein